MASPVEKYGYEDDRFDNADHETEVCEFRKVKCHDCGETKKEIQGIKDQLPEMKDQLKQLPEIKDQQREMKDQLATKQDILIAGGFGSSVETFSWTKGAWAPLPPMKKHRARASSFAYENQIFVAGGQTQFMEESDSVEILKVGEQPLKWTESPAKLPFKCNDHKTVVYQNSLIHVGGYNATNVECYEAISEVLLSPPYSNKVLCRMPEPRMCPGVEIFKDNILILGGSTNCLICSSLDSVLMYDVNKKECKQMPSLPRSVAEMATVSWRDKVVVIGGVGKNGKALSDVLMYDSKTGEINVLPSMQRERRGCSAVITGDVIVVMGGKNENDGDLSSVECFTLGGNLWKELPPMIKPRYSATAVVMPSTL